MKIQYSGEKFGKGSTERIIYTVILPCDWVREIHGVPGERVNGEDLPALQAQVQVVQHQLSLQLPNSIEFSLSVTG